MRARFLVCLPAILLFASCAGYQLGPTNGLGAGEKSVQINPFQNETLEPRLIEPVTLEIRRRVQQDGTYKLATHGDSDLIVNGVITRYERSPLSFQARDVLTVRDYNLTITVHIVAIDRSTGKTTADRLVRGRTTVRVGNDLASAERQAIPLVAADLARNAVSAIADGKW
ncbi:MAG: LptE family protein [Verrucomicrobiota bacterium]